MILVSACLIGEKCRYDGKNKLIPELFELYRKGELLPVCPEQLGGLPTPRSPSEIVWDYWGYDPRLYRLTQVWNANDDDVSAQFIRGAEKVLRIVRQHGIKEAILAAKSPSCGSGLIYDGTFSKRLVQGDGVTAKVLKHKGIEVITHEEFLARLGGC